MVTSETYRNILGIVGNAISLGLFLSPVPTFYRIWKNQAVEGFSPIPYVATILNCAMWVFYGTLLPHSIPIITINAAGVAFELSYLAVFFRYATRDGRVKVAMLLTGAMVIIAGAVSSVLLGPEPTEQSRVLVAGIFCAVVGVFMYASPLVATWNVVRTKSVRFMPFWLSLASFLNGVCWTVYAALLFDPFMMVPNGLGVLLGLAQLLMYGFYHRPAEERAPQVQMRPAGTVAAGGDGGNVAI